MKEFTMKFNKSFLFASIIAGSIALTACNDKEEKVAEKPAANRNYSIGSTSSTTTSSKNE